MVILGVGCNIGDRLTNLRTALRYIHAIRGVKVEQVSPLYESEALLLPGSPTSWNLPYFNLAIKITTQLMPEELLHAVKGVEQKMGRMISPRWSPRIIDIDILAWDDLVLVTEQLTIPHRELLNRPFALWPLADLSPDWRYPVSNNGFFQQKAARIADKFGSRFKGDAYLHTRQVAWRVDAPQILGIVNLSPDSFSGDGDAAINTALQKAVTLFNDGAEIIDVGAASTRPGACSVPIEQELAKLQSLIAAWESFWQKRGGARPKLSIDTARAEVIRALPLTQMDYLNAVAGLDDLNVQHLLQTVNCQIILVHNQPLAADLSGRELLSRLIAWGKEQREQLGRIIALERLIIDPGIGFGKTAEQSWFLLQHIAELTAIDLPLLVGHSRKSLLARFTDTSAADRDPETVAVSEYLWQQPINYLRVHNVALHLRAFKVMAAIKGYVQF